MMFLTAAVETTTSTPVDWPVIIEALSAIVVALITAFFGTQGGKLIMSKNELAKLEKEKSKEEVDQIKEERFKELLQDAAGYVFEKIIYPRKKKDPNASLTNDDEFRKEAEDAFLNFVRNVADERGLGQYVAIFQDDQLIVALKSLLGAGKMVYDIAKKFKKD